MHYTDADIVAKGTVENSYIFGKHLDKLHIATNVINKEKDKAKGNYFKNKEIIKELTSWEDRPSSIQPTSKRSNGGDGYISTLQETNPSARSHNFLENQEENSENIHFSVISKKTAKGRELIKKLESQNKIKAYRAVQIIDGEIYSPMAAKVEGKLTMLAR